MQCKRGILTPQGKRVPCGQCMPCRINTGRLWSGRILLEQAFTPARSFFLTFTISPAKMVYTADGHQTVVKEKFRKFVRSAQADLGHFRHVSIGEYGDKTGRAHYHMAIFPKDDEQPYFLTQRWDEGFCSASELSPQRARYIVKYTAKKMHKAQDHRLFPDQEPEFKIASPGIGRCSVPHLVERYRSPSGQKILRERGDVERTVRFSGRVYPIDTYILDKVREQVGVPLLHRDRLDHPGYYEHHQTQEATWEPLEGDKLEMFHKLKAKRRGRGQTSQI